MNGQTAKKGVYREGLRHGEYSEYDSTGVMTLKGSFTDGLEEGPFTLWNNDGSVRANILYKNGVSADTVSFYYPNGNRRPGKWVACGMKSLGVLVRKRQPAVGGILCQRGTGWSL
ncbi:MAG: hypothetical protein U0T82_07890 [Bacteroidales bacterium]